MNASLRVGATRPRPPLRSGRSADDDAARPRHHFYGCRRLRSAPAPPRPREFDTSTLRTCITGGASMPVEVLRGSGRLRLRRPRGIRPLRDLPGRQLQPPDMSASRDRSGRRWKGRDDGRRRGDDEVPGRGRRDRDPRPQRDEGYWQRPEATRRRCAALFHSAHARVDEEGYFFIATARRT